MQKNIRRIKVLHLYSSFGPGGAEKTMLSLVYNLNSEDVENITICPKNSYIHKESIRLNLKFYTARIRGSLDPIGIFNLIRIIRKERPDIIHVHQGKIFWPSIFMKWLFQVKVVFHRHADIRSNFYSRCHYRYADRIIAVSKKVSDNLIKYDKVAPSKISVIHNGVEVHTNSLAIAEIRRVYALENTTVIGTVGAINKPEGKGQKYLIDVAKSLRAKFKDLRYLIVGDGTLKKDLQDYAKAMEVDDIVIFTGYRENSHDYIAVMDIFCLLSVGGEAMGVVLVEAQMLGKPVVATKVGGIPETFIDGRTGILIPPRDRESLQKALEDLIVNKDKRIKMGLLGSSIASDNFNIRKWALSVKKEYESLKNYGK